MRSKDEIKVEIKVQRQYFHNYKENVKFLSSLGNYHEAIKKDCEVKICEAKLELLEWFLNEET